LTASETPDEASAEPNFHVASVKKVEAFFDGCIIIGAFMHHGGSGDMAVAIEGKKSVLRQSNPHAT